MEKERLIKYVDVLRTKLNYFDELENISTQFHASTMNVGSSHFVRRQGKEREEGRRVREGDKGLRARTNVAKKK